jgi:hypothetical protein
MKSIYLAPTACAALLFVFATAYAQTSTPKPADSSTVASPSTTPNTTGNDLLNGAKPPAADKLATSAAAGEDKADGNDLVSGDNRCDRETGTHPAWKTMDTQGSGYLTAN